MQSVRDLQPDFAGVAYTTLMTTLDRLHRKEVLDRARRTAAPSSISRATRREELLSGLAGEALEAVFGQRARELQPDPVVLRRDGQP